MNSIVAIKIRILSIRAPSHCVFFYQWGALRAAAELRSTCGALRNEKEGTY